MPFHTASERRKRRKQIHKGFGRISSTAAGIRGRLSRLGGKGTVFHRRLRSTARAAKSARIKGLGR